MLVNIMLLLAGNVMEPSSILLITAPMLFPVAMKLGIDPIHLGILMTVNMEIGMITPPVGLNLYVASGIANMGMTDVTKACVPWTGDAGLPDADHLRADHHAVAAQPADALSLRQALSGSCSSWRLSRAALRPATGARAAAGVTCGRRRPRARRSNTA